MLTGTRQIGLSPGTCHRAVGTQDARFDGVFFVAVTTTGIYCRPICPSRRARREYRRFFESATAAEAAGCPCPRSGRDSCSMSSCYAS